MTTRSRRGPNPQNLPRRRTRAVMLPLTARTDAEQGRDEIAPLQLQPAKRRGAVLLRPLNIQTGAPEGLLPAADQQDCAGK